MTREIEKLERSLRIYKGLVEVSALITAITDFRELLSAILDVSRRVMNVEASSLFLVNDAGDLQLVIGRGGDQGVKETDIVVPRGRGIAGWVLEHRKGQLVENAYQDPRFYREADLKSGFRTRSILCVPLIHDERDVGVVQVLNPLDREAFDETDLEAFEAYGNLAGTALERLRILEQQAEQARVERELSLARDIQNSFLPQMLPKPEGLRFAANYRPASNIGGDFYDVIEVGPDEVYFVIGDVSGKGIPAALLMAQSLSTLRLIIRPGVSPAEALEQWNRRLCGSTIRGMFITTIVGRITVSTKTIEYASAGHCPPMHVLADGNVTDVPSENGPPIGILDSLTYSLCTIRMESGEIFVCFTDGLIESFDENEECLDRTRVREIIRQHCENPNTVVRSLVEGERRHRGAADVHDDMTILVMGFK
jgi:sigma-B regulation protein RsbU (phosphoserine phosphatase)